MPQGTIAEIGYWEVPDAVVWVNIGSHRQLRGFDNYWLARVGEGRWQYGVWNDRENMGTMYDGEQAAAWEWDGKVERVLDPSGVTTNTMRVWRGVMLTDEQARFVGLI